MHLSTVKVPIDFGFGWPWSSVSYLTSNLCFSTKLCVSYSFALVCIFSETIANQCFTFHRALHIYRFLYACGQGPAVDRETVWFYILVGPLELNEPLTWWLALDFTSSYWFLPNYTHLTWRNFICQHSAIIETTVKQHPLAFLWFDFHWETPGSVGSSKHAHHRETGYPVCSTFHILISFVHISPISMLTNRPCHGPWMGLGDSGTVWPCWPCIN